MVAHVVKTAQAAVAESRALGCLGDPLRDLLAGQFPAVRVGEPFRQRIAGQPSETGGRNQIRLGRCLSQAGRARPSGRPGRSRRARAVRQAGQPYIFGDCRQALDVLGC
jgi:hypothetical protein